MIALKRSERAIELLTDLLSCGYADLDLLLDSKYPMCDIVEYAKEWSEMPHINDLIFAMIQLGVNDIDNYIQKNIEEVYDDLSVSEQEEFRKLVFEPHDDIEIFVNFLDSHAFLDGEKREHYEKYFPEAIKMFEFKTDLLLE